MQNVHLLLGISLLLLGSLAFPAKKINIFATAIDTTASLITETYVETSGTDLILYAVIVGNADLDISILRINATASPPTLLQTFKQTYATTIANPSLTLLKTRLILSFAIGPNYSWAMMDKATLTVLESASESAVLKGVYFYNSDVLLYHGSDEGAYSTPESATRQKIGTYNSGTQFPNQVKYLRTKLPRFLLALYKDLNYVLIRSTPNLNTIITDYSSPKSVQLPETGYQCACLSTNDTTLYILQPSGMLIVVDLTTMLVVDQISTGYLVVSECYYDNSTYGVVFVSVSNTSINTGVTTLSLLSLSSKSEVNTLKILQIFFKVDETCKYATTSSLSAIHLYQITTSCYSGYLYDPVNQVCLPCPNACTTCNTTTTCQTCDPGYDLTASYSCALSTPATSATPINTTADPTVINTTAINTTAINTTADPTVTTDPSSTTFGNSSTIDNSTALQASSLSVMLSASLSYMMNNTMMSGINQTPGGRRMFPFLCFLLSIDELWLYQYHERNYGDVMTQFFSGLQNIETQKWNLLGDEKVDQVYEAMGTTRGDIELAIDTKRSYTYSGFYSSQGKGQTFLPACWDFLTFNLLLILIAYIILRFCFRLLFNFRISIFLRAFSFAMYLVPLVLDGNLQYFFFLMFSQGYLGFSLSQKDKTFNVVGHLLCFVFLWIALVSSFLAYYLSRKLSKYVLDNWRTRINGLLSYSLSNAVRMIIMGAAHSLLRFDYLYQLPALMAAEGSYAVFLVLVMRKWRAHRVQFKVWFGLIFTFLRLLLLAVLFLQQEMEVTSGGCSIYYLFENILGTILNLYMLTFYSATALEIVYEIIQLFKSKSGRQSLKEPEVSQSGPLQTKKMGIIKNGRNSLQHRSKKLVKFNNEQEVLGEIVILQAVYPSSGMLWKVVQMNK